MLDLDTAEILGKIPGSDVHGIAILTDFGRGFVSASDPGSVTIFDFKSLAIIDKVIVGEDPNGIVLDPRTNRVFTADRGSKRVTAIDARTGKIAGVIDGLGGRTEHLAADGAGACVVEHAGPPHSPETRLAGFKGTRYLASGRLPTAEQMNRDRKNERVFIGCRSGVMTVVDGNTGRTISTEPIGRGVDATEFDPERGLFLNRRRKRGILRVP